MPRNRYDGCPHIHTNSQLEIPAAGGRLAHRHAPDRRLDCRRVARRRLAQRICGEMSRRVSLRAAGGGETTLDALGPSPVSSTHGEQHMACDVSSGADRAKDDFLAMLGHELRNPLAAIASATEILKRTGTTTGIAGQARAVIERQVRHLKRLVDDLLDAARVQTGKVTLDRRPLDLAEAVQQAIGQVQGTSASTPHVVQVDAESVGVNVDPTRLEQILVSLLTNAVKFTPVGRAIRVGVRAEADTAVLVVEDEGIGISDEILPRIFDLFFQGERTAARPEVAFIDIGLPVMDGYEVARTARRQADHATLLVALTGYGQAEDRQRSYDAGFDDFVVKPVDPARLTQILDDRTPTFRW